VPLGAQVLTKKVRRTLNFDSAHQRIHRRCDDVEVAFRQLVHDRNDLQAELSESLFNDTNLTSHMDQIKAIFESSKQELVKVVTRESLEMWQRLYGHIAYTIQAYGQSLGNSQARREYLEMKACLDRVEKLLGRNAESVLTCCVCLERQVKCSAKCGHLLCATCTQSVDRCPICREPIQPEDVRTIYF
jgi:hypothetical protein